MGAEVLLLEPIGGISGDLFLGAMVDLGLELEALDALLRQHGISGFGLRAERLAEHGIFGTRVTVEVGGHGGQVRAPGEHVHGEPQGDSTHAHAHGAWREIRALLERFPTAIAERSLAIFGRLANVEAHIHGVAVDDVVFHEVGALDSIVDILGAAWALNALGLGADDIYTLPPPLGSGLVRSQHGVIPVPAPATWELLLGKPTKLEGVGELTTPTGAAILAACARFEMPARFSGRRIGYGVGHHRFPDRPNLLRATLGQVTGADGIWVLEAHLDDATPQLLGHLLDRLLSAGALDAGFSPLAMKKGRPGQRLTVVCRAADRPALSELVFRESPTLGLRAYPVEREELERHWVEVETPYGRLRVKQGLWHGQLVNSAPEYEDCLAAASTYSVPLKQVIAAAITALDRLPKG